MAIDCTPIENSTELQVATSSDKKPTGLAPLLLTVVELIRQLMEAQVIRRMEEGMLDESALERAGESLQKLEKEVIHLCEVFDVDPSDLNVNLGDFGTLLPHPGSYYPGENSNHPSLLELLDRILNTGVVVNGDIDLGIAELNLIHAKLRLVLTSKPI